MSIVSPRGPQPFVHGHMTIRRDIDVDGTALGFQNGLVIPGLEALIGRSDVDLLAAGGQQPCRARSAMAAFCKRQNSSASVK